MPARTRGALSPSDASFLSKDYGWLYSPSPPFSSSHASPLEAAALPSTCATMLRCADQSGDQPWPQTRRPVLRMFNCMPSPTLIARPASHPMWRRSKLLTPSRSSRNSKRLHATMPDLRRVRQCSMSAAASALKAFASLVWCNPVDGLWESTRVRILSGKPKREQCRRSSPSPSRLPTPKLCRSRTPRSMSPGPSACSSIYQTRNARSKRYGG